MLEIANLRNRLPGAKAGQVLDAFDRIENIWAKQDVEQFPFNTLSKEIDTIRIEVREAFSGELDLAVDRRSAVFDLVVALDHRFRIYSELVAFDPIYHSLERRLQRIDDVLPSRNYAIGDLLSELRPSFDPNLKRRLESAVEHFGREEYESVLTECGKAEGMFFSHFKRLMASFGISELPDQTGSAIRAIRRILESKQDTRGLSLAKSSRVEHFVLYMSETLHYLRNLGAHDRAEEVGNEKLPEWQIQRRELFTQKPEYARLALVLAVQIAVELQALLERQELKT